MDVSILLKEILEERMNQCKPGFVFRLRIRDDGIESPSASIRQLRRP